MPNEPDEIEKIVDGIIAAADMLKTPLINVLNGIEKPETLEPAIERFRKVLQPINNKNIGLILGIGTFTCIVFPLTGDAIKDLGQKNETPAGAPQAFDEEFLKNSVSIFADRPLVGRFLYAPIA